jgi:hypothetical protein
MAQTELYYRRDQRQKLVNVRAFEPQLLVKCALLKQSERLHDLADDVLRFCEALLLHKLFQQTRQARRNLVVL